MLQIRWQRKKEEKQVKVQGTDAGGWTRVIAFMFDKPFRYPIGDGQALDI